MASDQMGARPVDPTGAKMALEILSSFIDRASKLERPIERLALQEENARLRGELRAVRTQRDKADVRLADSYNVIHGKDEQIAALNKACDELQAKLSDKKRELGDICQRFDRDTELYERKIVEIKQRHKAEHASLIAQIERLSKDLFDVYHLRANPPILVRGQPWGLDSLKVYQSCSQWGLH